MYKITDYTKDKAKEIGVDIKPSKRKNKKVDVFKNGNYITSVGQIGYKDYPTYIKEKGTKYADERRKNFYQRFNNIKQDTTLWYSAKLLW